MEIVLPVLVNFIALVAILVWATRKPAAHFLITRSDTIAASISEAERMASEASRELSKWETSWRSCEAHSKTMFDEAKVQLQKFRESALSRARNEAVRIRKEGELVGQSERVKAKATLEREIVEKSIFFAGQYLGTHLREDDRHKLVSDYVEIVGNGKA
jgi:F-type H+-transporting ATPase subunit b